jgi:hypothetical protein
MCEFLSCDRCYPVVGRARAPGEIRASLRGEPSYNAIPPLRVDPTAARDGETGIARRSRWHRFRFVSLAKGEAT